MVEVEGIEAFARNAMGVDAEITKSCTLAAQSGEVVGHLGLGMTYGRAFLGVSFFGLFPLLCRLSVLAVCSIPLLSL